MCNCLLIGFNGHLNSALYLVLFSEFAGRLSRFYQHNHRVQFQADDAFRAPLHVQHETTDLHSRCATLFYSSSGGISSSIKRINVIRISVVSLPRRTSLTKCASTCMCTWPISAYYMYKPSRHALYIPSLVHPAVRRPGCWRTRAHLARGHRRAVPQSRQVGSLQR